jgi:hypothetical protein
VSIPVSLDEEDALLNLRTGMRFRTSVSQIKMFHPGAGGCPRKWALHYLSRVPRLPGQALTDGIRLHTCLDQLRKLAPEEWAKRWPLYPEPGMTREQLAIVKTAQLAMAMSQHTPAGNMPVVSEPTYMLDVPEIDTAIYIKPDLTRDRRVFVDWKSTSAVTRKSEWCVQSPTFYLTGNQDGTPVSESTMVGLRKLGVRFLQDDIQARVYAHGLMQQWREVRITAKWVYGSKRFELGDEPRTWTVEHTFERGETRAWVERYVWPTVEVMNTLRAAFEQGKIDSTLLVPHNEASCEGVGKFCDALGHCTDKLGRFQPSPIPLDRLRLPVLP